MDKSILQILDEAKQLLLPDSTDYAQPNRVFLFCNFLAPADFTGALRYLIHMYNQNDKDILYMEGAEGGKPPRIVIHGHKENELCSAPTFCHLLGYRPDSTNSPAFRKAFQQKWNY